MARKPFKGSTIDNVLEHGVGALNIDETRIGYEDEADIAEYLNNKRGPMERGTGIEGEQIGMFETGTGFKQIKREVTVEADLPQGRFPSNVIGEVEGYQKYFYCPKVSRRERHTGGDNNHPTVKPVELMKYLVKLVTPKNGVVLDPFCGSGSTGMAAIELGHTFIGCELDENYVEIARTRITAWNTPEDSGTTYEELFVELE
jgi:site-specific DNA-methyltransferase (adenine-specific)